MLSMTGFGQGDASYLQEYTFTVEISSVNRKQLELRCALPADLGALENTARRLVSSAISRGSVQMRVQLRYNSASGGETEIDAAWLRQLAENALKLRRDLGLPIENLELENLYAVPGVLKPRKIQADNANVEATFTAAVNQALEKFQAMRRREGEALKLELQQRASGLRELLAKIEPLAASVPEIARQRLDNKLHAAQPPIAVEPEQFAREMLFYLDKSDVTEEITRLKSHFQQFDKFLAATEPVGRSMDFLMQEFFREITTLGNKAATPELSPLTVAFKAEVEKLREQIQNVE